MGRPRLKQSGFSGKIASMSSGQLEGLSSREVKAKQKKFGYNELPNQSKKNILKIVFGLLTEPMIFLLMATVSIYFVLGDKNEAFLLLISFVGIISIGLYQELKTEKTLQALKNLSSPISDVIRDGKRVTINGREIVVGDIVILSEGSRVPADARLISADNFRVDESLLTGESEPVEKRVRNAVNPNDNLLFSGTLIVRGHGIAEVTSIGVKTEIGKIGTSLKSIGIEKTLLQKEVNRVVGFVAVLAISSSLLLTLVYWISQGNLIRGLLAGLTLAIAILPEEFPVVLMIFLTLGAWRLAKSNVLTRKAHTIETLGSTTVLCVDKTGTLTENQMRIESVINAKGSIYNDNFVDVAEIIEYGVLASQKNPYDPMEEAFILAGKQVFGNIDKVYDSQEIVKEYPVEDGCLSVAQVWGYNDKPEEVALKGAPETVFDLCHIHKSQRTKLEREVKSLAERGLRVLAIARGSIGKGELPDDRRDFDFEFLGLVGLADPVRKEVPAAVKICEEAGIRVIMITGDYLETAVNIAKQAGIANRGAITGLEFEQMSKSDRANTIKSVSVFSRVNPSHKLLIVNALKESGEVVAMTGDGVNDAPALKSAHVGIAMGGRGTDVAREAASIVLLDDNFTSIVHGVRLGRKIYDNLRKAMSYIISVHIPIALLSLLPVIFKWPIVLIPAHIVFLEFVIDPSCTIIFENEKESKDIMSRPPRKLSEPIFSKRMVINSLLQGLLVAIIVVVAFRVLLDMGWNPDKARGMTFLILVIANIFLILGISGKQAIANIIHRENKAMIIVLLVTSISLVLVFNVVFLRELFHFEPLTFNEASMGVLVGALSIFGIMPLKYLINRVTSRGLVK
ncbi:MAG: cation-translocating P-type ATPase [Candidatus Saccharibacteria bacterium]